MSRNLYSGWLKVINLFISSNLDVIIEEFKVHLFCNNDIDVQAEFKNIF